MVKCFIRYRMADKEIDDISTLMRLSGVSRNTLNKLYKGTDITTTRLDILIKLCNVLDCKLSDLIEYEPDKKTGLS